MKAKLQSAYISVEKIVFPLTKILDNFVFEFQDPEGNHIEVFSRASNKIR